MATKEKFYEYVRNATHGKKCYVIQGSRKMFLTVPAKVFHCFDADREYVCRKMTEKLKKSNVLEFGRLFFDGT